MNRLISLITSGILTFLCISYGDKNVTHETCKAEVSFVKNKEMLNMVVYQNLFSGTGTLSISGVLYERDKVAGYISKTIMFTYEKKGYTYVVISQAILRSPQMTLSKDKEHKWLPAFFYESGKSLVWTIRPVSKNASLISSGIVPLFLCEKS